MSEQRFKLDYEEDDAIFIVEDDDIVYPIRNDTIKEYQLQNIVDLLNEQQATINKLKEELELTANTKLYSRRELERKVDEQQATICKLQDLCGESDGENAKLRIENKRLQAENEQLKQELAELLAVHTKIVETLDSEFISKALEDGD